MRRESVSEYVNMKCNTLSACMHLYTIWLSPLHFPVAYLFSGWSISQPKREHNKEHLNIVFTEI